MIIALFQVPRSPHRACGSDCLRAPRCIKMQLLRPTQQERSKCQYVPTMGLGARPFLRLPITIATACHGRMRGSMVSVYAGMRFAQACSLMIGTSNQSDLE